MKIVIDISEEQYEIIKELVKNQNMVCPEAESAEKIILKGTPLPKGHGDLKDMGNLQYVFDLTREDSIYSGKDIERAIKSMKSIIKADKAESEI